MLSFNKKKVAEYVLEFITINKDPENQNSIKELYDIILKLTYLRLFGGAPGLVGIIEVIPSLLNILEKKKITLEDNEISLIIYIIREYHISLSMSEGKPSESIGNIVNYTVSLCEP